MAFQLLSEFINVIIDCGMKKYTKFKGLIFVAIFAISDLHLSFGTDKPMNIFGSNWERYTERLFENWQSKVKEEDVVIIPGDISWAMYIEDAYEDFKFIESLNGTKILLKGNHDYWWTTVKKMENYLKNNGFDTIKILNNTAYLCGNIAICGTRGWNCVPQDSQSDDKKIFDREKIRLVLSLENAKSLNPEKIIVAMHYPPISEGGNDFSDILKEYGVDRCIYGHLHGPAHQNAIEGEVDGIKINLVSGDYINFNPLFLEN